MKTALLAFFSLFLVKVVNSQTVESPCFNDTFQFVINPVPELFDDARTTCINLGGDLVSVPADFVNTLLNSFLVSVDGDRSPFYLGLSREADDTFDPALNLTDPGLFTFVDGTPFEGIFASVNGIFPWGDNQPDNDTGDEACVLLQNGEWFDVSCILLLPSICARSCSETVMPTQSPSDNPTNNPTQNPTNNPTTNPTINPTKTPTRNPTQNPTTSAPTDEPTVSPTRNPSRNPTTNPTQSPTQNPTLRPTTAAPTVENDELELAAVIGSVSGCVVFGLFVLFIVFFKSQFMRVNSRTESNARVTSKRAALSSVETELNEQREVFVNPNGKAPVVGQLPSKLFLGKVGKKNHLERQRIRKL